MADTTILERFQACRTRQFLRHESRYRNWLPRWRTQHRRRILIVALCCTFAFMLLVGVICHFNMMIGPLLWLPACVSFFSLWTALQIVSGRQGDAPGDVLDEWEIQQRNSARSIGLTVTQILVFIPATYLIVLGSWGFDATNVPYSAGIVVLTTLLIGGCTPAIILGWTRPDPEPDDMSA